MSMRKRRSRFTKAAGSHSTNDTNATANVQNGARFLGTSSSTAPCSVELKQVSVTLVGCTLYTDQIRKCRSTHWGDQELNGMTSALSLTKDDHTPYHGGEASERRSRLQSETEGCQCLLPWKPKPSSRLVVCPAQGMRYTGTRPREGNRIPGSNGAAPWCPGRQSASANDTGSSDSAVFREHNQEARPALLFLSSQLRQEEMMFRFKSYYQPTPGDGVLEKLAWKKWGEKRGKRIRFSRLTLNSRVTARAEVFRHCEPLERLMSKKSTVSRSLSLLHYYASHKASPLLVLCPPGVATHLLPDSCLAEGDKWVSLLISRSDYLPLPAGGSDKRIWVTGEFGKICT
ncbi:hypothetical protein RRG08_044765 [Elysia crispata]|uniref:Uncharacterized protein n=1 Tax=Elysia crispata TaxID=231223 RepID=A0AAE0ZHZ0_9GAST|nr:hypothetical protein RRG08_044765 [Elysia crispata]